MRDSSPGKRVAVSGHQRRPGIDWDWTAGAVGRALASIGPIARGYTCLAAGSDQVFAREALAAGIPVTAVIPLAGYERFFEGGDREAYEGLLRRCDVVRLVGAPDDEQSFLAAGLYAADQADLLLAIWDGKPAGGVGGTADVVAHCLQAGKAVVHVDPILRSVRTVEPSEPAP